MPQVLTQQQKLEQRQQLSAQQILVAKLTELSVEELRARIETECEENPWLERKYDNEAENEEYNSSEYESRHDNDNSEENSEDSKNLDEYGVNGSDEVDWDGNEFPMTSADENTRQHEDGEALSFHELLLQQMGEYNLNEHQHTILEYLIGSLDDDGLLHTPLYQIADELDIYQGVSTSEKELEEMLNILQQFEPWGVGARNLCECLLLQVQHYTNLPMRAQLLTLLTQYTDEFTQKHWDIIQRRMHLSDAELSAMKRSILRLNPRPGGSIGRSADETAHTIIPDFFVETDENDNVYFQLSERGIPQLQMSEDPAEWMSAYDGKDDSKLRREVLEAVRYQRNLMERGNLFIEALAQRRQSLTSVMRAIIKLQEPFFRDGDETSLRPMKLEDVADITGLDISTVSRVCRSKTVRTTYGTYPLRWFFTSGTHKEGEELSVRHILSSLKELINKEDKRHPYSDEYLTNELQRQGYDVARRTVAKYREQLGIPNSRMRR